MNIPLLLRVAPQAREIIRSYIEECGGCNHSVGICMCAEIKVLDDLTEALNSADTRPVLTSASPINPMADKLGTISL